LTLRFDPNVIKIKPVSAGSIFANAKTAPNITQSIDDHGMLLVSLAPAADSPVSREGALLNFEVEAVGAGDSARTFDFSNIHLVTSDGRATEVQIGESSLKVKPPDAQKAAPKSSGEVRREENGNKPVAPEAKSGSTPKALEPYVVQRGDNLWRIAKTHNVSVA